MTQRREMAYRQARQRIRNGDLLLWRPTTVMGRLICRGTGQEKCHAAMAGWASDGRLYAIEMLQWHGGCHNLLSEQVKRWPGACDVYRVRSSEFDGDAAVCQMLWLGAQHYGWLDLVSIALRRLFPSLNERFPLADVDGPNVPFVCSRAVSWACRTCGGVDPDPSKPDALMTPGDLARGGFARYRFTLTVNAPQDGGVQ